MKLSFQLQHQSFALKQVFRIARGAKTQAEVLVLTLNDGQHKGWSEAVPYQRYGESIQSVSEQIQQLAPQLEQGLHRLELPSLLPAGAARNLLDCALWDLDAKRQNTSVSQLLSIPWQEKCETAQTLSIDSPDAMKQAAKALGGPRLIKVKLDAEAVVEKMQAIHDSSPGSCFIVDANEGWDMALLKAVAPSLAKLNVVLIEQPLSVDDDHMLEGYHCPVPLCADESCHTSADLPRLQQRYQAINIKLDKTGGLTEALQLKERAESSGMQIMLGCMVGSSLAMAPAYALAPCVQFIDLDGPALIAKDRPQGFTIHQGLMTPSPSFLWGQGS